MHWNMYETGRRDPYAPTSRWLELAANAYGILGMSSFVDMAATRVTQVRASLVCGRERQAAFEACTTGGNLHTITAPIDAPLWIL